MVEMAEVRKKAREAVLDTVDFFFNGLETAGVDDNAARLDAAVRLTDIVERWCMTFYIRELQEEKKAKREEDDDDQPPTERQIAFAKKLGIKFPEDITKKGLSQMIDTELRKRGRK